MDPVEFLQKQLDAALTVEDYETAAAIRDAIASEKMPREELRRRIQEHLAAHKQAAELRLKNLSQ